MLIIFSLTIFYIGLNFLKGNEIFSKKNTYYTIYNKSAGLNISNPILINGFCVGMVKDIKILKNKNYSILVTFKIDKDLLIKDSTIAKLVSSDLLGSRAIELITSEVGTPLKKYDTIIDLEKDSSVVSADPKIVKNELEEVNELSYNEARLAGMFGMKIVDPIAIKEILENGVEIPLVITNMKSPNLITKIQRKPEDKSGHPLKIVTGKKNCAILRIESDMIRDLLVSLDKDKRYSEFIVLSPFTKDGIEFSRILFLDGDYVKRNEKYILSFDALATIAYERGVVTLIGDEMWRVQQIASKASSKIGDAGLNILNMDAQEETSRIIIVIEDAEGNVAKAIESIHSERSKIKFI